MRFQQFAVSVFGVWSAFVLQVLMEVLVRILFEFFLEPRFMRQVGISPVQKAGSRVIAVFFGFSAGCLAGILAAELVLC